MNSSLLLHYADKIGGSIQRSFLEQASLGEKAKIVGPVEYKSRNLYFLDLSSENPTGTFKDWLACVTIAYCLQHGIKEFVTQTSGNTGNALVRYAEAHGIKVTVFYPKKSRYKIQSIASQTKHSIFIELDKAEPEIKKITSDFSQEKKIPWLPLFEHQIEANKIRAYFVADWCQEFQRSFHWHSQSLSSGYGIFAFYRGLNEIMSAGSTLSPPSLLGVNQSAVAPYYDFIHSTSKKNTDALQEEVLEPTLFRTQLPEDLLNEFQAICKNHGGSVTRINKENYIHYLKQSLDLFSQVGLILRISPITQDYSEKAGLLALMGTIKEIDSEFIPPQTNILVTASGGFGVIPSHEFVPKCF